MTITIDRAFVTEYRDQLIYEAQQGETRLRSHVNEVSSNAETYTRDILDKVDTDGETGLETGYSASLGMYKKSGRRRATQYHDDTWHRRSSTPDTFNHTMTIENEDKVQMLIDPMNSYRTAQSMLVKRFWDRLVIEAASADVTEDGSTLSFPAGQIVGDGSAAISFSYIQQIQEKFMDNEIMMDMPKVAVVGPTQVRQLMALTQATSSDYVNAQALQNLTQFGIVPNWMGMTWIVSNYLEYSAADKIYCLFMTKYAIDLIMNSSVEVIIDRNPEQSYMWQVFIELTAHALRVEDEQIVIGHFKDS